MFQDVNVGMSCGIVAQQVVETNRALTGAAGTTRGAST